MSVIRIHKTKDYTVMSNTHFKDKSLSLKAKGLLSLMLSLPEDWDYSIEGLSTLSSDGRTAVRTALNELEEHGYLQRERTYTNGKISDIEYHIYECPQAEKLNVENLTEENLLVENNGNKILKKENTKEIKETNKIDNTQKLLPSSNQKVYMQVVEMYNQICSNMPKVRELTDNRKKAIQRILKHHDIGTLKEVFEKANSTSFLLGDNDKGWKANLDFILKEDKFVCIMEGKYDSRKKNVEGVKLNKATYTDKEREEIKRGIANGRYERV